jgi:diadenylate cyclase
VNQKELVLSKALPLVTPGSPLREGLDRILQANMGALIVIGDTKEVLSICTGGFSVESELSSQKLSELAKMDGAIILSKTAKRIVKANVQLVPDPQIPTSETGTRHRTAERVAKSMELPVIAVSEDLGTITLYCQEIRHELQPVQRLWNRANQLLQTLERFKNRFDSVVASLSALELSDLVTVRDVASVLQRAEMVERVAKEARSDIMELGKEGSLLSMQLAELIQGIADERNLVIQDYAPQNSPHERRTILQKLSELTEDELVDIKYVAAGFLNIEVDEVDLEKSLSARGNRMLSHIPRLPISVVDSIVAYFGTLQKILRATEDDLGEVSGVGEARARSVKQGLVKLTEASIIDRYTST